jgi:hypothetical protein
MHHDDYLYTRSPTSREVKRKEFAASHLNEFFIKKSFKLQKLGLEGKIS